MTEEQRDRYDVVVLGGGAAGLSGALMLTRALRSVLVIDAGQPRNAPADGVHGLLGRDGMAPGELLRLGGDEVIGYGGRVLRGAVRTVSGAAGSFTVALADGGSVLARRLLVASGLDDELPDIAGLRERWGRDVLHCPYCHGWEVRGRAVGVLATSQQSVHQALLFRQWSADVSYFAHETAPSGAEAEQLAAMGIRVVRGVVSALEVEQDRLAGLRLADGSLVRTDALAIAPTMRARTDFLSGIGLRAVAHSSGMGEHIAVDATGRTEVPGVWAAGNVTDLTAQVGAAAAGGALAGAHINADLIAERTDAAVAAYRAPFSAASESRVAELVAGHRRHGW